MLRTSLFLPTLKENPKEAEVISHILLLRSGMVRQVASGIYTLLPLGYRVLKKIIAIVSEEMDAIGANALFFPFVQPAELWQLSGRWDIYGKELLRFKDRLQRDFLLSPTHEEVCTSVFSNEVHSYKQLPITLYQIHWKFRDELRPRYGLLRTREFLMKDAYSFHATEENLNETYTAMYKAYSAIFSRLALRYVPVEADTGSIGGGSSHEFMVLTDIGEDTIVTCSSCSYSANIEKALVHYSESREDVNLSSNASKLEELYTPDIKTIEKIAQLIQSSSSSIIKSVAYMIDEKPVLACVRGDRTVSETKLKSYLKADVLAIATATDIEKYFFSVEGFIGPQSISTNVTIIFDNELLKKTPYTIGANKKDFHYTNFVIERDMSSSYLFGDIRTIVQEDRCPQCSSTLEFKRGIEVGHIFKLGTKYSEAMKAQFLNADGVLENFVMGCYGIGITRLLSAIIEQSHDDKGIIFPMAVAPFQCTIIPLDSGEDILSSAQHLYACLKEKYDILFDDRNERAGVKLNDADLIGIPIQIILGKKSHKLGLVECKIRATGEKIEIPLATFVEDFSKIFTSYFE